MNTTPSVSEILTNTNNSSYSTVNKTNKNYSTVKPIEILSNLSDVIHEGYEPFYIKQMKLLGYNRFMELVAKARAGSDTPQKLFSWMLKNHELVR